MFTPGQQLNQFTLRKVIYTSRLSQIWQAEHTENGRRAGIKIALTWQEKGRDSYGEVANSFIRNEAEILRHLCHPGLVQIFPLQVGEDDIKYSARISECQAEIKPWYFAMKWIEGKPLGECLKQVIKQPFEWRMELFFQLLGAIEHMHHCGYAHMDLKPENLIVAPITNGQGPHVAVIDLGCASDNPHELGNDPGGTDQYAPIELLLAMHSDLAQERRTNVIPHKVDIWSLGAIFFELVTGEPLFEASMNALNIRDTILGCRMKRINDFRPSIRNNGMLDAYLELMLKQNPEERVDIGPLIQYLEEQVCPPPRL